MEIKGPNPITSPPTTGTVTTVSGTALGGGMGQTPAAQVDTLRLSGLPAFLQTGQQLEVIVAALEEGQLILQLPKPLLDAQGNRTWIQFRTPATLPAQIGQQLVVEVMDATPAHPVLKLTPASALPFIVQTALNSALQKQDSATALYAALTAVNQPAMSEKLNTLPEAVRTQLQTLWRQLPDSEQLQHIAALKRFMQNTGEFLEANILQYSNPEKFSPNLDVRVTLLRLASALREQLASSTSAKTETVTPEVSSTNSASTPTNTTTPANSTAIRENYSATQRETAPPHTTLPEPQSRKELPAYAAKTVEFLLDDLLRHSETALARIQTHQLQMVTGEQHRSGWLMELPIRHDNGVDIFDLRIHPDAKGHEHASAAHGWTVMLAFDLEGLGPMRVQVSLRGETISTYWWAEQSATVALFNEHFDALRVRLKTAGLTVDQLRCQMGKAAPTAQTARANPYSYSRIDEHI